MLLAALVAGGVFLATRRYEVGLLGLVLALLVIPLAATFRCPVGWPRWVMVAICGALALVGVGTVVLLVALPTIAPPAQGMIADRLPDLFKTFTYGTIGAQFASNYLAGVRVTR